MLSQTGQADFDLVALQLGAVDNRCIFGPARVAKTEHLDDDSGRRIKCTQAQKMMMNDE